MKKCASYGKNVYANKKRNIVQCQIDESHHRMYFLKYTSLGSSKIIGFLMTGAKEMTIMQTRIGTG